MLSIPCSAFAGTIPTWIQNADSDTPGPNTITATFSKAVSAGDSIICSVNIDYNTGSNSVVSIVDSAGNTYAAAGPRMYNPYWGYYAEVWYVGNVLGGSGVTVTLTTANGTGAELSCHEFSGITAVVDQIYQFDEVGVFTYTSSISTSYPNELVYVYSVGVGGGGSFAAGFNWVSGLDGDPTAYFINPTPGSVTATDTWDHNEHWTNYYVTFTNGCKSPTGVTGQMHYLAPSLKYCDGTNWQPVNHTVGAVCTAGQAGTFHYASSIFMFCNGSNWVSMQGLSLGTCTAANTGHLTYDASTNAPKFCDGSHWYSSAVINSGISLFAGNYVNDVDGTGTAANFNGPQGIARDAGGNLYVGDNDARVIRKITPGGVVTTLAGNGFNDGVDGAASVASFRSIYGIVVDSTSTNLYVLDYQDSTVRKVVIATGAVSTFAGSHYTSAHADGTGTAASFQLPTGIAIDGSNNLYIADPGDCTIRKVTSAQVVTTIAGTPGSCNTLTDGPVASALFDHPFGIAVNSAGTKIWVSEQKQEVIRLISGGTVSTVAGTAGTSALTDGTGTAANFLSPQFMTLDSTGTNLYVADNSWWNKAAIRKMVVATNVVSTLAGSTFGYADGTGAAASFAVPMGVAVDGSGTVYVTDNGNNMIRKVTSGGVVTTFAGNTADPVAGDGIGTAGRLNAPRGMVFDSGGNLVVVDSYNSRIKKILPSGYIDTFAGWQTGGYNDDILRNARFNQPLDIAIDASDNLYVIDIWNSDIRKIDSSGNVTTIAGGNGAYGSFGGGYVDATGTFAAFHNPNAIAISTDGGTLYVSDGSNNAIRKVVVASGVVTTLAGQGPPAWSGYTDGASGALSQFNWPASILVDPTNTYLYVSDAGNFAIRRVTIATGATSTLAGGSAQGYSDGTGAAAKFSSVNRMALDPQTGNFYVYDCGNAVIRKVTPGGAVTTVIGTLNTKAYYTGATPGKINCSTNDASQDVGLTVHGGYLYFGEGNAIMRVPLP